MRPCGQYALQYDKLNRVTFETNAGTPNMAVVELTRQYDADSQQTALLTKVGSTLDFQNLYQFDELDRMIRVEQSGQSGGNTVAAKRVDLAWDAASRLDLVTRYKDLAGTQLVATSDYVWDKLDRPTALTHAKNAAIIADYDWTYDKLSRKTSFVSSIDGTVNYGYDAASQLTTSDVAGTSVGDEHFGYDDAGNRNTNGFTVGTNNRMLSDGVYNYEYDDEGNRTKRTKIIGGQYDVYTWDHRNRLTLVTTKAAGGGTTLKNVAFVYDAFDRRLAVQVDTNGDGSFEQTKRYAYDGQHVAFVFSGSTPASLTNRYLHGPAIDQVFADEQLGNEVLWSLTDDQGTVRDLIDGNGTVENHIKYGSFGNVTSESNGAVDHIFGYTGREFDEATGLTYYRARYYDAPAGEFLSEDPIGFSAGDFNVGRYVGNSPTNATDPLGLNPDAPRVLPKRVLINQQGSGSEGDGIRQSVQGVVAVGPYDAFEAGFGRTAREAQQFGAQARAEYSALLEDMLKDPTVGTERLANVHKKQLLKNIEQAARHAYWQMVLKRIHGADAARAIGDIHEGDYSKDEEEIIDSARDLINNEVARGMISSTLAPITTDKQLQVDKETIKTKIRDALGYYEHNGTYHMWYSTYEEIANTHRDGQGFVVDLVNDPRMRPTQSN